MTARPLLLLAFLLGIILGAAGTIAAALGIVTGEDDDGNMSQLPSRQPATKAPATNGTPFYSAVASKAAYYKSAEHVQATMALLGLEYPADRDAAKATTATLERYAQLRADGLSQTDAVAQVEVAAAQRDLFPEVEAGEEER